MIKLFVGKIWIVGDCDGTKQNDSCRDTYKEDVKYHDGSNPKTVEGGNCLLYTSDAADE